MTFEYFKFILCNIKPSIKITGRLLITLARAPLQSKFFVVSVDGSKNQ
jgi:hypothetical protein